MVLRISVKNEDKICKVVSEHIGEQIAPSISSVHPKTLEIENAVNSIDIPIVKTTVYGNILFPRVATMAPRIMLVIAANNLLLSSQI